MPAPPYRVYIVQGQTERDWSDCQNALGSTPARVVTLPFIGDANALIARTRDADALVVAFSPITRAVLSALEGLDDRHFAALGVERVSLEALVERSDYVSVHTLLTRRSTIRTGAGPRTSRSRFAG